MLLNFVHFADKTIPTLIYCFLSHFLLCVYSTLLICLLAYKSGCCKPPDVCEMEYVNAINWTEVRRNSTRDSESSSSSNPATNASHVDCHAWSNQPAILCYDCQSCKAAFLTIITSRWRKVGVFLIVMSTLFLFVHAVRFIILMSARFKP